jgi:peptide/nickel transport system substrate-binding protein
MRIPRTFGVLLACILFAACTTSAADPGSSPPPPPRGNTGGTLTLGMSSGAYFGMDPQNEWSFATWELFRCCLLRTLMSYRGTAGPAGTEPQPDLAATPPDVSTDGLTWTFHLRPGLHYAPPFEEVEITSADIVRAVLRSGRAETANEGLGALYLRIIDGYDAYADGKTDSISGLETPDRLTLRVREVRPNVTLPYVFTLATTAPIPPSPADPAAPYGVATGHDRSEDPSTNDGYGRFLVSSGPYMIEGADQIDFTQPPDAQVAATGFTPWRFSPFFETRAFGSITLVRNPSWDPATDPLRAALPDRIEVVGGDAADLFRRFDSGSLAVVIDATPPPGLLRRHLDDPSLRPLVHTLDTDSVIIADFNLATRPFDDIAIRRAVAYALDRRLLVAESSRGFGFGAATLANHYASDAAEGALASGWDPFPGANGAPDLAAAKRSMAASDYVDGGRCTDPACDNVVVLVDPALAAAIGSVRSTFRALGIDAAVRAVENFYEDCQDPDIGAAMCIGDGWFADFPSAGNTLTALFGATYEGVNLNHMGASPKELADLGWPVHRVPSVDRQIERCNEEAGVGQITCWTRLDQYLVSEVMPVVPLAFIRLIAISSPSIASFSWDQAFQAPALDRLEVAGS